MSVATREVDPATAAAFLNAVFGVCESGNVTLFDGATNKSARFAVSDELEAAGRFIEGKPNFYFNVGIQDEKLPESKRGEKKDVRRAPMLWADLDLAGKPDAKKKYPTREHAEAALADMPLAPSLIVFSGGGFYPLWLFNEAIELPNLEAVLNFEQELSWPWQQILRQKIQRYDRDYALDSTWAGTWMLRAPGSVRLSGHYVCVLGWDGGEPVRYDRADVEAFCSAVEKKRNLPANRINGERITIADLTFDANAKPRPEVLAALRDYSDKFAASWERNGHEPGFGRSECLYSLTDTAVRMEVTDQGILDLRIAWMRRHNQLDESPSEIIRKTRFDIWKKRAALAASDASIGPNDSKYDAGGTHDIAAAAEADGAEPDDSDVLKRRALKIIQRRLLCREIIGAVQFGVENATYALVLRLNDAERLVKIGTSEQLVGQTKIRARLMETIRRLPPKIDKEKWPGVVKAILAIAEVREAPSESEQFRELLREYLESIGSKDWTRAVEFDPETIVCKLPHAIAGSLDRNDRPREVRTEKIGFFRATGGRLFIKLTHLEEWLGLRRKRITNLTELLQELGFRDERVRKRHEGRRHEGRYWVHPNWFEGLPLEGPRQW